MGNDRKTSRCLRTLLTFFCWPLPANLNSVNSLRFVLVQRFSDRVCEQGPAAESNDSNEVCSAIFIRVPTLNRKSCRLRWDWADGFILDAKKRPQRSIAAAQESPGYQVVNINDGLVELPTDHPSAKARVSKVRVQLLQD